LPSEEEKYPNFFFRAALALTNSTNFSNADPLSMVSLSACQAFSMLQSFLYHADQFASEAHAELQQIGRDLSPEEFRLLHDFSALPTALPSG
jgi:hypothetical protein